MAKNNKTNAMRMLDRAKIKYEVHSFEVPEASAPATEICSEISDADFGCWCRGVWDLKHAAYDECGSDPSDCVIVIYISICLY